MLTQDKVKELFEYKDGKLYSKVNRTKVRVGDEIGYLCSTTGYVRLTIYKKKYKRSRIVFLYHNGYFPKVVDHINGNTIDDRIENLREADLNTNQYNSKIRKDSTSGIKNVSWHKYNKKWRVRIRVLGKEKIIGYYDDLELAALVAEEARNKYHKEFARHE